MKIINNLLNILILQWFWVRIETIDEKIIIDYNLLSFDVVESGIASMGRGETMEIKTTYLVWFITPFTKLGSNSKHKSKHMKRLFSHKPQKFVTFLKNKRIRK